MKLIKYLSLLLILLASAEANATSIWGAADRGPAQGTYRIPVDTSSSSSPGQVSVTELQSFIFVPGVAQGDIAYFNGTTWAILTAGTSGNCLKTQGAGLNPVWGACSGGGSGTVTTVSVASANGFAGTVANATTTPALTISTSVTGILKGNGTAIIAATAGTDYQVPLTFSTGLTNTSGTVTVNTSQNISTLSNLTGNGLVKTTGGTGALSTATSGTDYAPGTSGNATGIVKSTTGTGALTTAVAGDFPTLNQNTTGSAASFTGSLVGDVTGTQGATVVGKINGTSLAGLATGILKNTATTGVPSIAASSDIVGLFSGCSGTQYLGADGACHAAGGGSGTVTSASVVTANGFGGTVANPTTTPAITLSTSVTGLLKGNGTAINAAAAGTDYQAPVSLTTTGTSGAATFSTNTLNIPQYQGALTLTTSGTTGAATLSGNTINIPQYSNSQFQAAMAAETQLSIGGL